MKYECLSDEIKIGDYYLRLLLEEDENEESAAIKRSYVSEHRRRAVFICCVFSSSSVCVSLRRYEFFNELYHRFLLTPKVAMKCLCLQALAIVYGRCCEEIGPFADTKYIVGMLDRVSVPRQVTSGRLDVTWLTDVCCFCSVQTSWRETDSSSSSTNSSSTRSGT